jgi:hypothetical protein
MHGAVSACHRLAAELSVPRRYAGKLGGQTRPCRRLAGKERIMQTTRWLRLLVIAAGLMIVTTTSIVLAAAEKKQYQVTGTVVSSDEKTIVVKKGDENWEIERNANTKVDGRIAVGEKITVHYHMVADHIDARNDKGK